MFNNKTLIKLEKALEKGDGEAAWRALYPHSTTPDIGKQPLFSEPNLLKEVESLIEMNRPSIAKAYNQYKIKRMIRGLQKSTELLPGKREPVRRFKLPAI